MSTASPRDIIAAYFGGACADRTLSALTAAGYRVVLEGELEGRMSDETAKLLSEGLELCVRARKMDAMDRRATALGASKEEGTLAAMADVFGHPMNWPVPPRRRPKWYQFAMKKALRSAEAWFGYLSQDDLDAFWGEVAKGQSVYEDAGGYLLRCFRALMALSVDEPVTLSAAIEAILPTEDR